MRELKSDIKIKAGDGWHMVYVHLLPNEHKSLISQYRDIKRALLSNPACEFCYSAQVPTWIKSSEKQFAFYLGFRSQMDEVVIKLQFRCKMVTDAAWPTHLRFTTLTNEVKHNEQQ